jgi:hypothetical protein
MAGYLPFQEGAVGTSHWYCIPVETDLFNGLLALMQLQRCSGKGSIHTRRYAATLNEKVLENVLGL